MFFTTNAKLLFNGKLYWQAMAVPAVTAWCVVALHRLVTQHCILNTGDQRVAKMRQAIRKRRPIIEAVGRLTVALANRCLKGTFGMPQRQNLLFNAGEL